MNLVRSTSEDSVFLTDCFKQSRGTWERYYLQRLSAGILTLIRESLDKNEQALFNIWTAQDEDLDSRLDVNELHVLLQNLSVRDAGTAESVIQQMELQDDQAIQFTEILTWFNKQQQNPQAPISTSLGLANLFSASSERTKDRLRGLTSREELKQCVLGYRRTLRDVRTYKGQLRLQNLPDDAMDEVSILFDLLQTELSEEAQMLFDLFSEIDSACKGRLNQAQQRDLFRAFDPEASEEEIGIYMKEVNAESSLQYLDFVDWWEQSKRVPQSLVSRKKHSDKFRENAFLQSTGIGSILGGLGFAGPQKGKTLRKLWADVEVEELMQLCSIYRELYLDLRAYKMDGRIAELEATIADILRW